MATVTRNKTAGQFADEFIANPHRLAIAHSILGIVAACAYWVRPGTFTPYLEIHPHGTEIRSILLAFIAWFPYLISVTVSRRVLGVRDKKAATLFIVLATAVTASSVVLFLNLIVIAPPISPIVVSIGVTVALLSACGLCAFIWPNDAPE